jgi:ureidoglycolate lyase
MHREAGMSGQRLAVIPLSRDAFAAFGDVIESEGRAHHLINAGSAQRFDDLASVDVTAAGGRPQISLCRTEPVILPLRLRLMERHPLSSQAFIPLSATPFLIVVAPAAEKLELSRLRAFRSNGRQGINYRPGTWHHPLLALEHVSDFLIVDRGGEGANCDEIPITEQNILLET